MAMSEAVPRVIQVTLEKSEAVFVANALSFARAVMIAAEIPDRIVEDLVLSLRALGDDGDAVLRRLAALIDATWRDEVVKAVSDLPRRPEEGSVL